jgi:transcription initiation factor TFIIIB Brf1 subunit/transcription initiation factor TFIIB
MFDMILDEFGKSTTLDDAKEINNIKCCHENVTTENNVTLCIDCGEEIEKTISQEKEWRYYTGTDSRHTSDPNRCQARRNEEKNIYKDVEKLGFEPIIVDKANSIYMQVTKIKKPPGEPEEYKIYRGKSRKSIICACIFNAYKLSDNPQTCDSLIEVFKLDRKSGLAGLKHVNMNTPKKSPVRTTYITPVHLVEEIMDKFSAKKEQKEEVVELYMKIKNKSSRLNRSRPQSVASGMVYYWIKLRNINITLDEFTSKVNLSKLTITKVASEISSVLDASIKIDIIDDETVEQSIDSPKRKMNK